MSSTDYITNDFYDADGDQSIGYFDISTAATDFQYQWLDNAGTIIPTTAYTRTLSDLATQSPSYSFPLTLEITNKNVKIRTAYGNPNSSDPVVIAQRYLISYQPGIYAVRPASLGRSCQWLERTHGIDSDADGWVCASQSTDQQNGHRDALGGGHSIDYIPDIGFKPDPSGSKFPTVGFPGAEFTLVMVGNQSDYTFSSTNTTNISLNSATGNIVINSKPSSSVKITAHHNPSNVDYDYTFTINKWVMPQSGSSYNYASAIAQCSAISASVLSRTDFTNSPIATIPEDSNWAYQRNYGTRAIDGSLYGEWGYLSNHTYPSSNWQNNRYWTKDRNEPHPGFVDKHFFVHSYDGGYIGDLFDDDTTLSVVCK